MKHIRTNINGVVGEISDMPGCPQVAVSHYVFMKDGEKGQGSGQKAHRERLRIMKDLGYDHAICTVVNSNEVEKHILDKQGWKRVDFFTSSKTGHLVEIFTLNLKEYRPVFDPESPENQVYDAWERSFIHCRS
jgi:L-amino acid N-acyltransferase YncA